MVREPSRWKTAGAVLFFGGMVAFVLWNPDETFGPGELTFFKVMGGIAAVFILLGLVGQIRLRIDPRYASRQRAWQAYSAWHLENTAYLIGLIEKGYTDEQIAIETVSKTGCDYEQALDDAKQLRVDHQANLANRQSDSSES